MQLNKTKHTKRPPPPPYFMQPDRLTLTQPGYFKTIGFSRPLFWNTNLFYLGFLGQLLKTAVPGSACWGRVVLPQHMSRTILCRGGADSPYIHETWDWCDVTEYAGIHFFVFFCKPIKFTEACRLSYKARDNRRDKWQPCSTERASEQTNHYHSARQNPLESVSCLDLSSAHLTRPCRGPTHVTIQTCLHHVSSRTHPWRTRQSCACSSDAGWMAGSQRWDQSLLAYIYHITLYTPSSLFLLHRVNP